MGHSLPQTVLGRKYPSVRAVSDASLEKFGVHLSPSRLCQLMGEGLTCDQAVRQLLRRSEQRVGAAAIQSCDDAAPRDFTVSYAKTWVAKCNKKIRVAREASPAISRAGNVSRRFEVYCTDERCEGYRTPFTMRWGNIRTGKGCLRCRNRAFSVERRLTRAEQEAILEETNPAIRIIREVKRVSNRRRFLVRSLVQSCRGVSRPPEDRGDPGRTGCQTMSLSPIVDLS